MILAYQELSEGGPTGHALILSIMISSYCVLERNGLS